MVDFVRDIKNENVDSIKRLALFDPNCKDEYGHQVIDHLVLDALSAFGFQMSHSATEIKKYIRELTKLEFEEAEIIKSGKRLQVKELISLHEDKGVDENQRFQITQEAHSQEQKSLNKFISDEEEVFWSWKAELRAKYGVSIVPFIDQMVEGIKLFLAKLTFKHGAESALLIYPKNEDLYTWIDEVKEDLLNEIPGIEEFIKTYLKSEIPEFFVRGNPNRRQYINSLLNSSFFWHLIQIDDKCSSLIRGVTKNQKLFLDNNILYSLVGFHGAEVLESVHHMLSLAGELGYQLLITDKTIEEFQESLSFQLKEHKNKPLPPKSLAKLASEVLAQESFITTFWKELSRRKISIEEFILEKSHINHVLQGLNIQIFTKYRKSIEQSQEFIDEVSLIREACGPNINPAVLEHDAYHRVLINKIRRGPKYKFSNADVWFLTHDSKLPFYDKIARKGKDCLPFCITSNQWIQINRPLIKRTDNNEQFEKSFHTLVTQPFVRSMLKNFKVEHAREKVLNRLFRFENMEPALALKIETDVHFINSINPDFDDKLVDEKIESKILEINDELVQEKSKIKLELDKVSFERASIGELNERLKRKVNEQNNELIDTTQILKTNKNRFEQASLEVGELTKQVSQRTTEINELRSQLDEVQQELKEASYESDCSQFISTEITKKMSAITRGVLWSFLTISLAIGIYLSIDIISSVISKEPPNLMFLRIVKAILSVLVLILGVGSLFRSKKIKPISYWMYFTNRKKLKNILSGEFRREYSKSNPINRTN